MIIEEFKKEYGIIGRSKEMRDLIDITMQVAKADISILIYGESGVGKEVFARAIHAYSNRKDKPLTAAQSPKEFWKVNCSDTKKDHSPVHSRREKDILKLLMAELCSWMKLVKCL